MAACAARGDLAHFQQSDRGAAMVSFNFDDTVPPGNTSQHYPSEFAVQAGFARLNVYRPIKT